MFIAQAPTVDQPLTLQGLWLILRRRSHIVITTALMLFGVAILVCVFMTRKYEATGEIQVAKQSSDGLGLESMMSAADGASDALDANITMQTQASILQSDTLALRVINNLHLEDTKDFKPSFSPVGWALGLISPKGIADPVQASLEDSPKRRTHAVGTFESHLKVKPVSGTRLIDISYTSSDPRIAAAVINQLTKGLVDYTFQTRYTATNQASQWLAGQLDDVKKQAEGLQARVVQLQRDSGVYSLGTADATGKEMAYSATLDSLQQATEALTQARSNRILKGGIYQMVKSGDPELISGLAGNSLAGASAGVNNSFTLLQNLRGQQATLQTQIASDTSKYGSANPKLEDERASLDSIDIAIQQEVKRIGERAQNDYRAAQLAENDMQSLYQKNRLAADKLNDKAIEYSIVKQEALESRGLYETLFQHLKEAGVIEGLHSSNITVVDPGRIPAKPVKPNVPVYLGLSLCGGLFLGSMGALFAEAMDDRVQSAEMVERSLQAPLLGVLPMAGAGAKSLSSYLSSRPKEKLITAGENIPVPTNLAALDAPNTAFTEALRGLRTSLLLSRSEAPPKVILVTSAAEGEGKSTIAANLGAVLAQNGGKVLLVEADMRRPGLSRRFKFDSATGLSSLLSGSKKPTQIEAFAGLPNLSIIPAGPIPPYPSELLGSKRMREVIEQWSKEYDFVLIDSPPMLAVTDAAILSKLSDVTLLVSRHAQSTRKGLERAYRTLRSDEATKVGVVLNGISRESASYGEYYGYYGDSYYVNGKEPARA
jgi:succinoglycan biosynthesis transport protein ExoP